jgi:hypothetical protein
MGTQTRCSFYHNFDGLGSLFRGGMLMIKIREILATMDWALDADHLPLEEDNRVFIGL